MAEISRRAGVGSATLYRKFAGRRELLEALYADEIYAVCQPADTITGDSPGAILAAWLLRFYASDGPAGDHGSVGYPHHPARPGR